MDGFDQLVLDAWKWNDEPLNTNKFVVFKNKLKHLKERLKEWHKMVVAQNFGNMRQLIKRLDDIDVIVDVGNRDEELALARIDILKSLSDLEKLEDMDVAQKGKSKWVVDGDENSKIFHSILKRKKMMINGIMSDGEWVTKPIQVKDCFYSFFKEKFSAFLGAFISQPSSWLHKLSFGHKNALISWFSHDEIKVAVWSC